MFVAVRKKENRSILKLGGGEDERSAKVFSMDVTQSFCAVKSKATEPRELTELDRLIDAAFEAGDLATAERLLDRKAGSRVHTVVPTVKMTNADLEAGLAEVETYEEDRRQLQSAITTAATETIARFAWRSFDSLFEESTRKGAAEATLALSGSDRFGEIGDPENPLTVADLVERAEGDLWAASDAIEAERLVAGWSPTQATLEGRLVGLQRALDEVAYRADYVDEAKSIAETIRSGEPPRLSLADCGAAVRDVRRRVADLRIEDSAVQNPVVAKKKAILQAIGGESITYSALTRKTQFLGRRERDELLSDLVACGLVKVGPRGDGRVGFSVVVAGVDVVDPQLNESRLKYLTRLVPRLDRWELAPLGARTPRDIAIVSAKPEVFQIQRIDSATLDDQDFPQEYLVDGILTEGEPGVIGGAEKSLKTTIAIEMAVSLASGTPFLGQFPARKRKVFFLSGESGGAVIRSTAKGIARARNWRLRDLDVCWSFDIPQLGLTEHLKRLGEEIDDSGAKVVFVDPLYLALLRRDDGQAINLASVNESGEAFRRVGELFRELGATGIILHHASKTAARAAGQKGMSLSDLSMAGISEFVRQWVLLCRRGEFAQTDVENQKLWMSVGGSSGHHGNFALDVTLGPTIGAVDGRDWAVSVRPADQVRTEEESRKQSSKATEEGRKVDQRREKLLSHLGKNPGGATKRTLQEVSGLRGEKLHDMINSLEDEGKIEPARVKTSGGTFDGFRLTRRDVDADRIDQAFPMVSPDHSL